MKNNQSQIETTQLIKEIAGKITGEGVMFLNNTRKMVLSKLIEKPYNNETKEHEASIRWKRTADQILKDGYVYHGKVCTDLTIVLIALCNARGFETRFVKLIRYDKKTIHSVAEVKLKDGWYVIDVERNLISKAEIQPNTLFNNFMLWKKGRDSWDLGLNNINDAGKII